MSFIESILFPPKTVNAGKLKKNVSGKTLVITGATFGIGEGLVKFLSNFDCRLVLIARTQEKLAKLKSELSENIAKIEIYTCDLRDEGSVRQLVMSLNKESSIDIFVNNAGKSIRRSVWDSTNRFHDYQRTNSTNYLGPVQLLLGILPKIKESQGQLINISAINVLMQPAPMWSAYQASKAAFDQWFRSVELELRSEGIRTNTVYLPLVRTRMMAPTKKYEKYPAMSVAHVVKIISQRLYKKNRNFKPYWAFFGQVGSLFFGRLFVFFQTRKLKNTK